MNPTASISLGGLHAAQTALAASAHNIANSATGGFRRQVVTSTAREGGGVGVSLDQAPEAGHALETDVLGLLTAKNHFLANLVVFKTSDAMARTVLDLQA